MLGKQTIQAPGLRRAATVARQHRSHGIPCPNLPPVPQVGCQRNGGFYQDYQPVGGHHRYAVDQFCGGRTDPNAAASARLWWAANVAAAGLPMLFMGTGADQRPAVAVGEACACFAGARRPAPGGTHRAACVRHPSAAPCRPPLPPNSQRWRRAAGGTPTSSIACSGTMLRMPLVRWPAGRRQPLLVLPRCCPAMPGQARPRPPQPVLCTPHPRPTPPPPPRPAAPRPAALQAAA